MKKVIAMVLVTLMVGMVAHAELQYATAGTEKFKVGVDKRGKEVVQDLYYLKVTSDIGDSVRLEVTEDEYNKVLKAERDAKKSFVAKVGTSLTFWNPND